MTSAELDAVRSQLEIHEGNKPYLYDDATGQPLKKGDTLKGNLSGGVGRNFSDRPMSDAVRRLMLDEDVNDCLEDLARFPWFGNLDPIRIRGVIDFRFQLGANKFRGFKKFLAAMAVKDYREARAELMDSDWYRDPGVQATRKLRVIWQICDGIDDGVTT